MARSKHRHYNLNNPPCHFERPKGDEKSQNNQNMKKIILSIIAAAATLACTKNEVAYEPTHEIGFTAVAGNMTKAVVDGTTYPTDLNMYVFAWTTDYVPTEDQNSPNYINNGEFKSKSVTVNQVTKTLWGGTPNPYYWPNTHNLHFAGYSKSGNVENIKNNISFNCYSKTLFINGYAPGRSDAAGGNDLMWFASNEHTDAPTDGYDKTTESVPVNMYHTCAWITFLIKGDSATAGYTLKDFYMTEIDQTANVKCWTEPTTNGTVSKIEWSSNTDKVDRDTAPGETRYDITINETAKTLTTSTLNIENGTSSTTTGNIVVIPQTPGKLNLKYEYQSSTGATIKEEYIGEKAIPLTIDNNTEYNNWLPGKHYIYTITIKANEILIAPTPKPWGDPTNNGNITVE